MPKRGRKKKIKLKISNDSTKSIISVSLLVGAGISAVSFFVPDYTINSKVQEILRGTFGYSSVFIPLILGVGGLLYIRALKLRFVQLRIFVGLIGLLVSSSGALEVLNVDKGGGAFGKFLSETLSNLVSVYGAAILFFAMAVVSLIFLSDISFDEAIMYLQKTLGKVLKIKGKVSNKEEKTKKVKDDIKISSGPSSLDAHDWEAESEKLPEPSFEVVPSMSEPLTSFVSESPELGDSGGFSISPKLPYSDKVWELPPLDILVEPSNAPVDRGNVKARAGIIEETLRSFNVDVKVAEINYGPSVTQYALETSSGTKIAKISSLQYDLALALASPTGSVRIEAPIPGRSLIGIEVPNNTVVTVNFKDLYVSDQMRGLKSKLGIVLGKDVGGAARVYDISKMPHLLVAGATGSGKSVFLHSLIFSLLFKNSPTECRFIFIDPKRVELVHYADIPHLYTPVVTDSERASSVFKWAVQEMMRRYKLFETAKVRNLDGYNEKSGFQALPYIVIVVDELAEIMVADPASVEKSIIRLAQLARATGIHLILTVQRPSTNVITGLIKANIPCRIAFNVSSQIDSRVIIDQPGAEKLLGKGDMLFVPPDASKPIRIQGSMVVDKEINQLVSYLKSVGDPEYREDIFKPQVSDKSVSAGGDALDAHYDEAVDAVVSAGKASASLLQRRLSVGYARAARILDELEAKGIIGPPNGSKPRDVLIARKQPDLGGDPFEGAQPPQQSGPSFGD